MFDSNSEWERVARLWIWQIFHHDSMWLTLGHGTRSPANEAMDRSAALRLVQWELVAPSIELVAAILQPVRPRDQHCVLVERGCAKARGAELE
jgi:hypothetical protein